MLCLIISIDLVYYRVASLPEAIPTLDWTMYQSRVNVTGMVADFKKQYEGLTIPYPKDSYSSKIAEQEKTAVSQLCAWEEYASVYQLVRLVYMYCI